MIHDRNKNQFFNKRAWVVILFVLISIIFCRQILTNLHYWGQKDWDQFTFWYSVPYKTIVQYHQFPLWNPYANGGNVLLAHPHSGFLNPFYIFVVLLGPIIGIKLLILMHVFLGLAGMFLLSRFLGLASPFVYVPPFIYMLNSIFPLHLTEGHVDFLSMAYIPWILLFMLKAKNNSKYIIYAIVAVSMMLAIGAVYPFMILLFFIVIFSCLQCIKAKNAAHLKIVLFIILGVLSLSAIKLIPMSEFMIANPREVAERDGVSLSLLGKMLTDSKQEHYDAADWKPTGVVEWHEYGAYVGLLPIILFLIGAIYYFKKYWPLIMTSLFFLVIVFGNKLYVDAWDLLHNFPVLKDLSTNSRFILGFVAGFSILAGFGLEKFYNVLNGFLRNRKISYFIVRLLIILILCDLIYVNSSIFKNAFVIKPLKIEPLSHFCQVEGELLDVRARSSLYPAFLRNCGVVNGYEVMQIKKGRVRTYPGNLKGILSSHNGINDAGNVLYLAENNGNAELEYFSPNIIKVFVDLSKPDTLMVNQNFHNGWKIKESGYNIFSSEGLIATNLSSGKHHISFYYLPTSFLAGCFVSFASFLLLLCAYRNLSSSKE